MKILTASRAVSGLALLGALLVALVLLIWAWPSEEKGGLLDARAALAAVNAPVEGLLHVTETAGTTQRKELWVDPKKKVAYQEDSEGGVSFRQVMTPAKSYTYDSLTGTVSDDPAAFQAMFDPSTYYATAEQVVQGPDKLRKTGVGKVGGQTVEIYEAETMLGADNTPEQKANAKLFVDPETSLVIREEYEVGGSLGTKHVFAREVRRVPRDAVTQAKVLTPDDLYGIAKQERSARLEKIAALPFESWSLGERFGNARLEIVIPEEDMVRYEYVDADNPERFILAIVVRDTHNPGPQATPQDLEKFGKPPDKTSVPNPGKAKKIVRNGEEITYQLGEEAPPAGLSGGELPPGPGEPGGPPADYPIPPQSAPLNDRMEFASFERGSSGVLVQVQGEIRGLEGQPLSAIDLVGELKSAKDVLTNAQ